MLTLLSAVAVVMLLGYYSYPCGGSRYNWLSRIYDLICQSIDLALTLICAVVAIAGAIFLAICHVAARIFWFATAGSVDLTYIPAEIGKPKIDLLVMVLVVSLPVAAITSNNAPWLSQLSLLVAGTSLTTCLIERVKIKVTKLNPINFG